MGLLSRLPRSKCWDFRAMKEKVQKVVASWKRKFFSISGKGILNKAKAQAFMSCIKLPKSLWHNLSRYIVQFWWGSLFVKKKIHWMNWKFMCFPKAEGVMGFRDLEGFNQAILAKQAWKFLYHPSSIVARLFKGRHF